MAIDDLMSRLSAISDDADGTETVRAAYKYLGRSQIVEEDYVDAETKLTYLNEAGTNVTGLDRFGRVVDQLWMDYDIDDEVDRYTYTYDRAGNRTSRDNELHAAFDEDYTYDDTDRLETWLVDGTLQKTWGLDGLGNNLNAGTYNSANEETPTGMTGDLYDLAGNMTTLASGKTAKYDAWNRLVEVDDGSTITERYEYDGTGRRIQVFSSFDSNGDPGTVTDDYHLGQQTIETDKTTDYNLEDKEGTAAGGYQMLWSPRYIDAPILRDTLTTDQTSIVAAERVFYLADANYNVTGLLKQDSGSGDWEVVERYTYTPYGVATVRYGNDGAGTEWLERSGGSAYANTTLYTGRELRTATGLYYYRARFYDAGLERFVNRDPAEDGNNLYEYVADNPIIAFDPSGLLHVTQGNGHGASGTGDPGNSSTKNVGGGPFHIFKDPGDGDYLIQEVTVNGSFSCQDSNGNGITVAFTYSYTEYWPFHSRLYGRQKEVTDNHNNSLRDTLKAIQNNCPTGCDFSKCWTFSSDTTFTLYTGNVYPPIRAAGTVDRFSGNTRVTDGDGLETTLVDKDGVMDMVPGHGKGGGNVTHTWTPTTGPLTATDHWETRNCLPKKNPKCWSSTYNPGGYQ